MSDKELSRLEVMKMVQLKQYTVKRASLILGLSLRQVKRLLRKYREYGAAGLAHKLRGRAGNRKRNQNETQGILDLITERYAHVGPTLAKQILEERHDIHVSREWLRLLLIAKGIWRPRKLKKRAIHQRRYRRSQEGELIQIDGSYHAWFGDRGPKCCLLVMIDDATSKLKALHFVGHESSEEYFGMLKQYIFRYGKPKALYSDRHSIFKPTKESQREPEGCSQFQRAMKELGIELIHARSPQAKGRVERVNGTLQDRLIKLMQIDSINTIEQGNAYLETFMEDHNKRYAVEPANKEDAHGPLGRHENLDRILAFKDRRKIQKDLSISYNGQIFIIQDKAPRRLIGSYVEVIRELSGNLRLKHGDRELKYMLWRDASVQLEPMDRKRIDAFLDRKVPLTTIQKHRKGKSIYF